MSPIRRLLLRRHLAGLIVLAVLALKLLVPGGYMIDGSQGRITIIICSGTAPRTMTMAVAGMQGDMSGHGTSEHGAKAEMPCAFAGLSAPMLGTADPIQLAALIAFVLMAGLAGVAPPPASRPVRLRPPPIGPPARR